MNNHQDGKKLERKSKGSLFNNLCVQHEIILGQNAQIINK
jgi:hypothetical protein